MSRDLALVKKRKLTPAQFDHLSAGGQQSNRDAGTAPRSWINSAKHHSEIWPGTGIERGGEWVVCAFPKGNGDDECPFPRRGYREGAGMAWPC